MVASLKEGFDLLIDEVEKDYYGEDCEKLVHAIREYKRIKRAHRKDQLYLADLLK